MPDATPYIQVRMSAKERALFEKSLSNKPVYLEFGCGGSTEIAAAIGCSMIVSVDSDKEWIDKLSAKPIIQDRIKNGSLLFEYIDIGPVGDWGAPKTETKIRNWPNYCISPFKRGIEYKYIFIDGRFRNTCAYVSWAFMMDDTLLAVHDYRFRPSYYDIEKFFDLQEEADTLVILKKRKNVYIPSLIFSIMSNLFNY